VDRPPINNISRFKTFIPKWGETMLKVGSWVQHRNNRLLGYIVKVDDGLYFVKWYTEDGKKVIGSGMYSDQIIKPAAMDIKREDILEMQELAVKTNDKQWFLELGKKLKALN
jgi:hypothetical protein